MPQAYRILPNGFFGGEVNIASSSVLPPLTVLVAPEGELLADQQWLWAGSSGWVAVAAPLPAEPAPVIRLLRVDFLRRLTQAERIAIRQSTDPIVVDFVDLLWATGVINLQDADLALGLGYLVSIGILTAERVAEITVT